MSILLIALGAALGAACRHLVTSSMRHRGATAAGGVLVVNLSGSLLLGLIAGTVESGSPAWLLPLVGIGFCGAYTTFATHAVELAAAVRERRIRHALADLGLNLVLGLGLVALGWALTTL